MAFEPINDLAVPLGPNQARGDRLETLAQRVKMVLDTRPGQLPWRKDFGCDLGTMVGEPITEARMSLIQFRITSAIQRWVSDVDVRGVHVDLVRDEGMGIDVADRRIPLAESALVRFGVRAALQIRLDLMTEAGPLSLDATLAE
jgi:phage baseplate assembly protein W